MNQVSEAKNFLLEEKGMGAFIYTACILFPFVELLWHAWNHSTL